MWYEKVIIIFRDFNIIPVIVQKNIVTASQQNLTFVYFLGK